MTIAALPAPFQTLLHGAIDYAGLFPPASLSMAEAVANYAAYRASDDRLALGRFILAAGRVEELVEAVARIDPTGWRLSVAFGSDPLGELVRLVETESVARDRGIVVDCFEAKVTTVAEVERLARVATGRSVWYGEVAPSEPFVALLDALGHHGGRAKLRMGGVTPEVFPDSGVVARFLVALAVRGLGFKATAGLHHPVRGSYRLTYRPDAVAGPMYGYLNLMVAVALAQRGSPLGAIEAALLETDPHRLAPEGRLGWDGLPFDAEAVDRLRAQFDGFGSCSFREPMDELPTALGR